LFRKLAKNKIKFKMVKVCFIYCKNHDKKHGLSFFVVHINFAKVRVQKKNPLKPKLYEHPFR